LSGLERLVPGLADPFLAVSDIIVIHLLRLLGLFTALGDEPHNR
jgi:hypothetical protein